MTKFLRGRLMVHLRIIKRVIKVINGSMAIMVITGVDMGQSIVGVQTQFSLSINISCLFKAAFTIRFSFVSFHIHFAKKNEPF